MKAFGLTGNIGCGKSTVMELLKKHLYIATIDCDRLAKGFVQLPMYREQINDILGIDASPGGQINLGLIAKTIFQDPIKKKRFEDFFHPRVWSAVETIHSTFYGFDNQIMFIVESAIIYEIGEEGRFDDGVIVVTCNEAEQIRRLREDRRMDETDIKARMARQLPSAEKESRAQFVIHTDCSRTELAQRVKVLYEQLKEAKEKK